MQAAAERRDMHRSIAFMDGAVGRWRGSGDRWQRAVKSASVVTSGAIAASTALMSVRLAPARPATAVVGVVALAACRHPRLACASDQLHRTGR